MVYQYHHDHQPQHGSPKSALPEFVSNVDNGAKTKLPIIAPITMAKIR